MHPRRQGALLEYMCIHYICYYILCIYDAGREAGTAGHAGYACPDADARGLPAGSLFLWEGALMQPLADPGMVWTGTVCSPR